MYRALLAVLNQHSVYAAPNGADTPSPKKRDLMFIDYKLVDDELVESAHEEDWRCAGDAFLGLGFELTQDEDNQQVCVQLSMVLD